MSFDISSQEVCVRVGVRYVITNFSWMDSLPNFLSHDAQQVRESSATKTKTKWQYVRYQAGGGGGDELVNRFYRDRAADDLGHRDVTRNLSREL